MVATGLAAMTLEGMSAFATEGMPALATCQRAADGTGSCKGSLAASSEHAASSDNAFVGFSDPCILNPSAPVAPHKHN